MGLGLEAARKTVTVYASSSATIHPEFFAHARELGALIAKEGWVQVNGGGQTGLMGAATEGAVDAGGHVDAVILDIFTETNMHSSHRNVVVEKSMPERKKGLYDRGDAFIALPGGLGTLEEMAEVMAWRQLNFHSKPIVLLNTRGYYDHLRNFLHHSIDNGFVAPEFRDVLVFTDQPEEAISFIKNYEAGRIDKARIWGGDFGKNTDTVNSDWAAAAAAQAERDRAPTEG